jgi:hypothetical protein
MMREQVAPPLREMGFRGSGQTFYLPSDSHWSLLGFQRSQWSDADRVAFTVNMTVVGRAVWESAFAEYPGLGEKPGANWSPAPIFRSLWSSGGYWHRRIGELTGAGETWWDVRASDDTARAADEVIAAIRDYAMPAMTSRMSTTTPG